jgi:glycosyltransferase involved in cell wall biosynthesis
MRVLILFVSTVPFGSNDLLAYKAAQVLLKKGHHVMASPWDWGEKAAPEFTQLAERGATIGPMARYLRSQNFFVRQCQKLHHKLHDPRRDWRFVDRYRPDVIVISDSGTYHFLSVPGLTDYLEETGIPYVTVSQYNDENAALNEEKRHPARRAFSNASAAVFVSHRNLDVARRQLCLELRHAVVIDNPPAIDDFQIVAYPVSARARFCMVARLESAVKGQPLVLQAFSDPVWKNRDWSLAIYGAGPDAAYLRELISYLGLQRRATLEGFVTDIRGIWREQQILVMASSGEGKPLALTEAMICGRPAVVTDVGGNAELVDDGRTGFVAQSATLASLRETLDRAWTERTRWRDMGLLAHQSALSRMQVSPGERLADVVQSAGRMHQAPGA